MSLLVVLKLFLRQITARPVRAALTALAISLSVSLVVAVTSGYASVELAAKQYVERTLASSDVQISGPIRARSAVPMDFAATLKSDPDVLRADPRLELELLLFKPSGLPADLRPAQVVGILRPPDTRLDSLPLTSGQWFSYSAKETPASVAVIDQVAAEKLGVNVGDVFSIPTLKGRLRLTVVGIVRRPDMLARNLQTVYLPLPLLQQHALGEPKDRVTRVLVDLKPQADLASFTARWQPQLDQFDPPLRLQTSGDARQRLRQNMVGLSLLSYLGGATAMLAATFIIFATLSMGLAERQRVLAMLRAIGATRLQLASTVLIEGLLLAFLGLLFGIPLGLLWVYLLGVVFGKLLTAGVAISLGGLAFAIATALAASVIASLLPAYQASRLDPLAAMNPLGSAPPSRLPWKWALAGLACIGFDLLLVHAPWSPLMSLLGFASPIDAHRAFSFWSHFTIGLPILMLGLFLLTPSIVYLVDRIAVTLIARLTLTPLPLLRHQLSGSLWRSAGTAAALMVGYSMLVVMQTQGTSALGSWKLPDKFPDVFIIAPITGPLNDTDIDRLKQADGIDPDQLMPVAVASPEFASGMFAIAGAAFVPDATMFFGIDPDKAFNLMGLDFLDGDQASAQAMLRKGRHIIVTQEYRNLRNITVGSVIPLKTTKSGTVNYTVAGVVQSPGMDVINGLFDLSSQFERRTAMSVFGTLADARQDFGVSEVYLFAANLKPSADRDKTLKSIQTTLGRQGVRVGDIRKIKEAIQEGLSELLLFSSAVAIAAMAVSALGVTNTIMASVRSRLWEMGILRASGATRPQLARLVIAEALVLGLCGCATGLLAGFIMVYNARGMSDLILGFNPPLIIPFAILLAGGAALVLITLAAAISPAISASRQPPLELLQAGRTAT